MYVSVWENLSEYKGSMVSELQTITADEAWSCQVKASYFQIFCVCEIVKIFEHYHTIKLSSETKSDSANINWDL